MFCFTYFSAPFRRTAPRKPPQGLEVPLPDGLIDDALLEIEHERVQPEAQGEADPDQDELGPETPLDDVPVKVPLHGAAVTLWLYF